MKAGMMHTILEMGWWRWEIEVVDGKEIDTEKKFMFEVGLVAQLYGRFGRLVQPILKIKGGLNPFFMLCLF